MGSQLTEPAVIKGDFEASLQADFYLDQIKDDKLREKFTSTTIAIPLREEGEEVVIDTANDLPEDSNELCLLLSNEECPAEYWMLVSQASLC